MGQLAPPENRPIIGARMPALSPDGKRLAFVYRGDIWTAEAGGGRATTLTRNVEFDGYPQFSPDGAWISFSSLRNGNWDIYIIPSTGGSPRRMTWNASGEIAYSWSPDGTKLVFTGRRESENNLLLTLDVKTGRVRKLVEDYTGVGYATYSPDGKKLTYVWNGLFPWSRPRYVGSGAGQIGLLDIEKGTRSVIGRNDHQHMWPRFSADGKRIFAVSIGEVTPSSRKLGAPAEKFKDSAKRTPNLWSFGLDGNARQVTEFVGGSVRFPNVATKSGDVVFEYDKDVWLLPAAGGPARKIALICADDDATNTFRHEVLSTGVTEAEPSPDGKTFAFGLRGDIFTIGVEKPKGVAGRSADLATRVTDWPGDDSDFVWSEDGKKLYYRSDRDYVTRLFEYDPATGASKSIWNRSEDVGELRKSPDGKLLACWIEGAEGGLYTISLADGAVKRIITMPDASRNWQDGGDIAWSPDMKYLALSIREVDGPWNIWIMPTAGGDPVNVTRLNATHGSPAWTPDGKYLLFTSDRDGAGLYIVPLQKEASRVGETDIKFEKPKGPVAWDIDFDGINRRIRKLTAQMPGGDLTVTPDGVIVFTAEGDIWTCSYDGKDVRRITAGGGISALRLMKDGKKGFFIKSGDLYSIRLEGPNPQEKITFTADFDTDVRAQRKAAFAQFWSTFNRRFYDANMHGRDWAAIRGRYEPLLDAVETRDEFSNLLGMMVGELESSHSEVGPAGGGVASANTPHLGFTYDFSYDGPGLKVDRVPPGTPGSFKQTEIKPGEYVLAINGKDVSATEGLYEFINNKQGREFTFLVNSEPKKEGARTVKYMAMSSGEWGDLIYRNRCERLRNYTEKETNGEVSYVHIAGMGGGNQTTFERELYEYSIGKKAMIIDVRFNGGGNISDTLLGWLTRKPHGYYVGRGNLPEAAPGHTWDKPIIVLMNEHSFSNAEMFPYAMRDRGVAKLVGMPTPGYVIWTWGLGLVDGTSARMPGSGVYRSDGTPMENMGEKPDVQVELTADDWMKEKDPQLDKAIEMLRKK